MCPPCSPDLVSNVNYPRRVKAELSWQTARQQIDTIKEAGVKYRTKPSCYAFWKHYAVNAVLNIAFISTYMELL